MASDVIPTRPIRLRDYRYPGEVLSLLLTLGFLISVIALAAIFLPTGKALILTGLGLGVYIITVLVQQRAALGTLVRVSARQFPELHERACVGAERLSSPPVPVYVKRASEMNIYTLGLWRQPIIVVTSSMVDQMDLDNLQFFIGREIGHIQARHTGLRTLLRPLGSEVPVFGRLLNSVIFGDWINRTELTADRAGFIACRSLTTAISTMLKFGVGIRLYEKLDIREFLDQIREVRNVRGRVTEIIAEQPYLTQRIRSLVRFALSEQFRAIVPERRAYTQILEALPSAFLTSDSMRLTPVEDEERLDEDDITLAETVLPEAEGEIDPRYRLIASGTLAEHPLRRHRTRLGRNRDNDIVVINDRVSRYHAEIVREGDRLLIVDRQSRNGVWVNHRRIHEPVALEAGDLIRIGRQEFTFTVTDPPF